MKSLLKKEYRKTLYNKLGIYYLEIIEQLNTCGKRQILLLILLLFGLVACEGSEPPQYGCFVRLTTDGWKYSYDNGTVDEYDPNTDFTKYPFPPYDEKGNIIPWSPTTEFVPVASSFGCADYEKIPIVTIEKPESRIFHSLVYHEKSGEIILIGGAKQYGAKPGFNDVWSLDIESMIWKNVGKNMAMYNPQAYVTIPAYDSESNKLIILNNRGETWSYDLEESEWRNMNPENAPSPRCGYMITYDSHYDRIVLFSGHRCIELNREMYDDTWIYDENSNTWTEMNPNTKPPKRVFGEMIYNSISKKIILWGGGHAEYKLFEDNSIWEYDLVSNKWKNLDCDGGPVRPLSLCGMYFDAQNNELTLIYGQINSNPVFPNTMIYWKFSFATNSWSQFEVKNNPFVVTDFEMTFHPILRYAVLFGGFVNYNTEELLEGTWVLDVDKLEWERH